MFTSEFTINAAPNLMVGGIDVSLGGGHHHHLDHHESTLINEWNPIGSVSSIDAAQTH